MIEIEDGTFEVAAEVLSEGLRLTPEQVMQGLRDGSITSLSERGIDEDAGRHRLTFFGADRRLRLTIDDGGRIHQRSAVDFKRPFASRLPEAGAANDPSATPPARREGPEE